MCDFITPMIKVNWADISKAQRAEASKKADVIRKRTVKRAGSKKKSSNKTLNCFVIFFPFCINNMTKYF